MHLYSGIYSQIILWDTEEENNSVPVSEPGDGAQLYSGFQLSEEEYPGKPEEVARSA